MRQKSEAQKYLEQVEKIEFIIRNKLIEKKQWLDIALGITANTEGERVQASGSQSRMADAVGKCVDVEREIDEYVDKLIDTKRDVTQTIEQLDSPTEYRLLHLRYIQYVALIDIAVEWGVDYSTVTTTHGRALKHVQEILDRRNTDEG